MRSSPWSRFVKKLVWKFRTKLKENFIADICLGSNYVSGNLSETDWFQRSSITFFEFMETNKQPPDVFYLKKVLLQISQNSQENKCNFRHRNFAKFLRTSILKNICELLLKAVISLPKQFNLWIVLQFINMTKVTYLWS